MPTSTQKIEKNHSQVLLAITGLSPQIIAKTKSYLQKISRAASVPAAVRVITSEDGHLIELTLLHSEIDGFHRFIKHLEPERVLSVSIQSEAWQGDVVPRLRPNFVQQSIKINVGAKQIFCGDREVQMSPQLFAWYVWMARRCSYEALEHRYVRWTDEGIAEEFLREYRKVTGPMTHHYEKAVCLLSSGMTQEFFQEKKARVNHRLLEVLRQDSTPYLIYATGRRPAQKFGLSLASNDVKIL
jgi:hypothetical protein